MEEIDLKKSEGTHNSLEINLDNLSTDNNDVKVIKDSNVTLGVDLLVNKSKVSEPISIEKSKPSETNTDNDNLLDLSQLLNDDTLSSNTVTLDTNTNSNSNDNIFSLDTELSEVSLENNMS